MIRLKPNIEYKFWIKTNIGNEDERKYVRKTDIARKDDFFLGTMSKNWIL